MTPDIWHNPRIIAKYPFGENRESWTVRAPFSMRRDRAEIIGTTLMLDDGSAWRVVGVERSAIQGPILTGEKIGLAVVPVPAVNSAS